MDKTINEVKTSFHSDLKSCKTADDLEQVRIKYLGRKGLLNTLYPLLSKANTEEKSDFNVELTSVGDKKINVIKVIRGITSLGLKEAKDLADGAPSIIKESVPTDEANEVKTKLEEAGATVTLK